MVIVQKLPWEGFENKSASYGLMRYNRHLYWIMTNDEVMTKKRVTCFICCEHPFELL